MRQHGLRRLGGLLTGFFLLLLKAGPASAQLAPDSARLALKLSVSQLLWRSYEAEVEYRLSPRLSLALLPRGVAGTLRHTPAGGTVSSLDEVRGYGLGLSPRYYVPHTSAGAGLAGLYVGLKAEYQHLRFAYEQLGWGEDQEANGLRYYRYRAREFTETIDRSGGAVALGYQCQVVHPRLRLDFATSLNALRSRSSTDGNSNYRFNSADYGYSGMFWTANLSLGFVL